jgi:ribosomal protein S18 acetylase RimI-like enzyme/ubiquinone/menaquinone biosynthesis C-methylase UbiE
MIVESTDLSSQQNSEVKNLITICEEYDNAKSCIQMDHSLNSIKELKGWMLHYAGDELTGILSMVSIIKNEAEISICVKPAFRKKGTAKKLLERACKHLRENNIETILIVCDRKSKDGIDALTKKKFNLHHSEYTMKYTKPDNAENKALKIRAIEDNDIERVSHIIHELFGGDLEGNKSFIESSIKAGNRKGYAGIIDNEIISVLFVAYNEDISINTLGVIKREQNKGYGKAFVNSIIKQIGCKDKDIVIDVDSTNKKAFNVYKSIGFMEVLTVDYYFTLAGGKRDNMMKEIDANKKAWALLAKDHYETYKKMLQEKASSLSEIIENDLGDIAGKEIIHLQCNTGADSISLARKGAMVTGIDLVPENIYYAKKLAGELKVKNIEFVESDIMELTENHTKKYDIVFTSEGVLCWLPDLKKWGQTIRNLLKENGFFYILDSHPFYFVFDENKFKENELAIKYPYFIREAEYNETIGGYASDVKEGKNYSWMYTIGDIINSLVNAGLRIEYFNEYDHLFFNPGGMEKDKNGNYHYPYFDKKMPFTFSLKARVK